MRILLAAALLCAGSALAQTAAKPAPKPLFEIRTHSWDDIGMDHDDVLIRVFRDGAAEYTTAQRVQVPAAGTTSRTSFVSTPHTAHLPKATVDRLAALLNDPATRGLKREYPAWHQWGFSGVNYVISFLSGSVPHTVATANVFPVERERRQEYPGGLLALMCAGSDVRAAVDAEFARDYKRQDCEEFPRLGQPAAPGR